MKNIPFRIYLLLPAFFLLAQSPPAGKTSVAVYPIKAVGVVDKSLATAITSLLSYQLIESRKIA